MITRITGVTIVTGLALLLSACGGEDKAAEGTNEVASLATATPGGGTSATPVAQERPLLRPDASQEEQDRIRDIYFDCLRKNGFDPETRAENTEEQWKTADAACNQLEPEEPWERAQRLDPANYADRVRDWVTCVRAAGVDAWEHDGQISFEKLPEGEDAKRVDECEMKAFAEVVGAAK
ncbi:hypothetical protein [Catenuloplanes japonicus]|uniref:hypothetical protein n=1 Tax=Catenuloplanes japonicus TaxID=33876 RepID=UPI00052494B4|nr:hypothetical protein [Catenuloplanes japonicus]